MCLGLTTAKRHEPRGTRTTYLRGTAGLRRVQGPPGVRRRPSVKVGVNGRVIRGWRRELAEVDVGATMAASEDQSNSGKGDDAEMLGEYPIDVVLLATDLEATRDFYRDKIGLELLNENPNAVTFKCGSNQLAITKSTVGTADEQTQAAWRVRDLDAELDALRGRGVRIEDYDLPRHYIRRSLSL